MLDPNFIINIQNYVNEIVQKENLNRPCEKINEQAFNI